MKIIRKFWWFFFLIFAYFSNFSEIKVMFPNELQAVANAKGVMEKEMCLACMFEKKYTLVTFFTTEVMYLRRSNL